MKVAKKCYAEMLEDAERQLPNEACGLLAGKEGVATVFYSMTNADQSPVRYLMDPREQFEVMKKMRLRGETMLGIYHSHVASQAYPSATDVALAFYPDVHYVIVSLGNRKKAVARAFRIEEGKVREEEIRIV